MTGDYSRITFRPERHYSGVRLQQGRVQLDSEWNEQVDIEHHVDRTTTLDVVGPTGVPEDAPGFGISVADPDGSGQGPGLLVGFGRGYVHGVLVENDEPTLTLTDTGTGSGADRVFASTSGPLPLEEQWLERTGDGARAQVTDIVEGDGEVYTFKLDRDFGAGPHEVRALVSYEVQPHQPAPAKLTVAGRYLAYLDVWEREVSMLEDPLLQEVALGGPDTALRTAVVWQVELAPVEGDATCKDFGADWTPEGEFAQATLYAFTDLDEEPADPCRLSAQGGYTGLENHLYRVQVHIAGDVGAGEVFFKWSRDNATHRTKLLGLDGSNLVVEDVGRDDATALGTDDWVEVLDEDAVLAGEPGFFVRLGEPNGNKLPVVEILDPETLDPLEDGGGAPDVGALPEEGLVRRWEGGAPVQADLTDDFVLEHGIKIGFEDGEALSGQYWTVAARTLTASIEWPDDPSSGEALAVEPEGVVHRVMPLALVDLTLDDTWEVVEDCRHEFPPLTGLTSLFYLGGDGQEVRVDPLAPTATVALEHPFRVGVARGSTPVEGALVRFTRQAPSQGALSASPGTDAADVVSVAADELVVATDDEGVAEAAFAIHPGQHHHTVMAELLDAQDPGVAERAHLPVRFHARTSVAAEVAYDPQDCAFQLDDGTFTAPRARTVQDALDKLCPRIAFDRVAGDGQEACIDTPLPTPLRVSVFWGRFPLEGARVGFAVRSGDATLSASEVAVDANGLAQVEVRAGSDIDKDQGVIQVEARLAAAPVAGAPESLLFTARFLDAHCVYVSEDQVDPACIAAAGGRSVSQLIDHLCRKQGGTDAALHAEGVFRFDRAAGKWVPIERDQILDPADLEQGVRVLLDGAIRSNDVRGGPLGGIELDLPYPRTSGEMELWSTDNPFAWATILLRGDFTVGADLDGDTNVGVGKILKWTPRADAIPRLQAQLEKVLGPTGEKQTPARVVIRSNRVWSGTDDPLYLDGDLFAVPAAPGYRFPSGDGTKGGNLVLDFRLGTLGNTGPGPGLDLDFLHLLTLNDGVFGRLEPSVLASLSKGIDATVDRNRLAANGRLDGIRFAEGRTPDLTAATKAFNAAGPLPSDGLRVLVHRSMEDIARQLRTMPSAAAPLMLETVVAPGGGNKGTVVARAVKQGGVADAVLVDREILEALQRQASTGSKLGWTLLEI